MTTRTLDRRSTVTSPDLRVSAWSADLLRLADDMQRIASPLRLSFTWTLPTGILLRRCCSFPIFRGPAQGIACANSHAFDGRR